MLEGSARRLEQGDIRDIIFEEHAAYPTPVTAFLERHGYRLFLIGKRLWGPLLGDAGGPAVHNPFDPPSTWRPATRSAPAPDCGPRCGPS